MGVTEEEAGEGSEPPQQDQLRNCSVQGKVQSRAPCRKRKTFKTVTAEL